MIFLRHDRDVGEAGGFAIVAYEATRREKVNVSVFRMCCAK